MSPQQTPVKTKALGQIEVMRVAAMTAIFFYHLWSVVPQAGAQNPFGPAFGSILSQGWMGVILFNIVSGFVLALPFAGPTGRPMPGYFTFLRHRFVRICPNYYIALIIWTVVAAVMGNTAGHLLDSFLWHASFLHSLNPTYFFEIAPAYWWMGLLAQFYLAFPLLWALFGKLGPKRATAWLVGGAWGLWIFLEIMSKLLPGSFFAMGNYIFYFNLPYRLPEFALGMYFACLWKDPAANPVLSQGLSLAQAFGGKRRALWAAIVAIWAWGFFLGVPSAVLFITHLYWFAAVLCFGLLVFFYDAMHSFGIWRPVARIAVASYSIYLMHQPFMAYLGDLVRPHMHPFVAMLLLAAICVPASIWMAEKLDQAVAKVNEKIG